MHDDLPEGGPVPGLGAPALPHEELEAVGAGGGHGQVEAVTPHAPDDGRGVHVSVRDLPRQQLPQNHAKRPAKTETRLHMISLCILFIVTIPEISN